MFRTPMRTRTRIHTAEHPASAAAGVDATGLDDPHNCCVCFTWQARRLPIGAFHFSQGLEYAVESGWVRDETSALEWIGGVAEASVATLDLPVLFRLHAAWKQDDFAAVLRWNAFLIASRETEELRAEDRHLGSSLLRVLAECQLSTELFPVGGPKPRWVSRTPLPSALPARAGTSMHWPRRRPMHGRGRRTRCWQP